MEFGVLPQTGRNPLFCAPSASILCVVQHSARMASSTLTSCPPPSPSQPPRRPYEHSPCRDHRHITILGGLDSCRESRRCRRPLSPARRRTSGEVQPPVFSKPFFESSRDAYRLSESATALFPAFRRCARARAVPVFTVDRHEETSASRAISCLKFLQRGCPTRADPRPAVETSAPMPHE